MKRLVQFLDTSFAEMLGTDRQSISRAEGDSMARYGEGMLPVDHTDKSLTSPIFNYPYDRTREALEVMRKQNQWDSCHGLKMQYINPVTGDYAMLFSYSDRPVQQKLGLWRESRGGQRDG